MRAACGPEMRFSCGSSATAVPSSGQEDKCSEKSVGSFFSIPDEDNESRIGCSSQRVPADQALDLDAVRIVVDGEPLEQSVAQKEAHPKSSLMRVALKGDEEDLAKTVAVAALELGGSLTQFQAEWCRPEVVRLYLRARKGNHALAGKILSQALKWREEHADILSGRRVPRWQGDMRVFARGEHGHPILLMRMESQPARAPPADVVDHTAAVLEAAVRAMGGDVASFDVVCDCYGFALWKNLDPRPVLATFEMLKHPYRNRLRHGFIVDAPRAFSAVWRVAQGAMAEATREKIKFVSRAELPKALARAAGEAAARKVEAELSVRADPSRWRFPSELGPQPTLAAARG